MPKLPKFDIPKPALPKLEKLPKLPKVELPKVELPKMDLPKDVSVPVKPLYAGAGVADAAYATVKEYAAGVQKKVESYRGDATAKYAEVKKSVTSFEPKSLQSKAKASYAEFAGTSKKTVSELQADAKALPGKARAKLDETTTSVTGTYDDLAKRGEVFVAKLRGKPAPKAPATKSSAKKAPASKSTAKKSTAKKAPAKKSTAKKTAAASSTAKKTSTTRTTPAKKA